ncbi:MAG: hypothetical protein NVS2B7_40270 [Herpetosiphon sp.]
MGQKVTLVGMLSGLRRLTTKKGDAMLSGLFEDLEATIEVVAFPRIYDKFGPLLQDDAIVALTAKVDHRREALQLIIDSVVPYTEAPALPAPANEQPWVYVPAEATGFEEDDGGVVDDDAWRSMPSLVIGSTDDAPMVEAVPVNGRPSGQPAIPINSLPTGEESAIATPRGVQSAAPEQPSAPVRMVAERSALASGDGEGSGPPKAPVVTVMRPRQRITIAKQDKGSDEQAAQQASGPRVHLRVRLTRTGDDDVDTRCMQEVHRWLCRFPGEYPVRLHVPKEANEIVLESGRRIKPDPALIDHLSALLGAGSVALESDQGVAA